MATETKSVLVTDVVASTARRNAVGELQADEERRAHDQLVTSAIEASSGVVVKGTGDGVLATFSGAAPALAAAVAVQRAIDRHASRTGVHLKVRVGVSAGDVLIEDGDCFGTPVIEASRLCEAADGGQILASEIVCVLARGRFDGECRPVGELDLKGLANPVGALAVEWADPTGQPSDVRLPRLLVSARNQGALHGRDKELGLLDDAWRAAADGGVRTIFLAGEPGIGKTRLAAEAAHRAAAAGLTVLAGRCDEDLAAPYQPFADALTQLIENLPPSETVALRERHGAELARLLPDFGPVPELAQAGTDPETERLRLFDATASVLTETASRGGLVLVLDDMHWAAKATVLLLRHILRHPSVSHLCVIVTYRDTDTEAGHPLAEVLADLRRDRLVDRILLQGLDEGVITEMVSAAVADDTLDTTALARMLWVETTGNSFFVREVLRHLSDAGVLRERALQPASSLAEVGLPESVRDVVSRRLGRLSDSAKELLSIASVVGMSFQLDVVEAVIGADALDALDEAIAAGILAEAAGGARFAHALIRETLYQRLTSSRRMRLHRRIGEALEARPGADPAALAHHFAEAALDGQYDKAATYALAAADRAVDSSAFEEAAHHLQRALSVMDLAPEPNLELRIELEIGLAELESFGLSAAEGELLAIERPEIVRRALEDARAQGSPVVLARVAFALSHALRPGNDEPEVLAACEEAVARLGEAEPVLRVRLQIAVAVLLAQNSRQQDRARALAEEALELARSTGVVDVVVRALDHLAIVLFGTPDVARRLTLVEEAVHLAASRDWRIDTGVRFRSMAGFPLLGLRVQVVSHLELGDVDGFLRHLDEFEALANRIDAPFEIAMASALRSLHACLDGRLDDAEAFREKIFGTITGGVSRGNSFNAYAGLFLTIERARARFEELLPLLDQAIESSPGIPAFRAGRALVLTDAGRLPEAALALAGLVSARGVDLPRDFAWTVALGALTEVAAAVDDPGAASVLLENLEPHTGHLAVTGYGIMCEGAIDRYIGINLLTMGDVEGADVALARAETLERRVRAGALVARTLAWRAALEGRRNRREEAAAAAAEARQLAESLGLEVVTRHLDSL